MGSKGECGGTDSRDGEDSTGDEGRQTPGWRGQHRGKDEEQTPGTKGAAPGDGGRTDPQDGGDSIVGRWRAAPGMEWLARSVPAAFAAGGSASRRAPEPPRPRPVPSMSLGRPQLILRQRRRARAGTEPRAPRAAGGTGRSRPPRPGVRAGGGAAIRHPRGLRPPPAPRCRPPRASPSIPPLLHRPPEPCPGHHPRCRSPAAGTGPCGQQGAVGTMDRFLVMFAVNIEWKTPGCSLHSKCVWFPRSPAAWMGEAEKGAHPHGCCMSGYPPNLMGAWCTSMEL